jgi:hypothetical protein
MFKIKNEVCTLRKQFFVCSQHPFAWAEVKKEDQHIFHTLQINDFQRSNKRLEEKI